MLPRFLSESDARCGNSPSVITRTPTTLSSFVIVGMVLGGLSKLQIAPFSLKTASCTVRVNCSAPRTEGPQRAASAAQCFYE